MPIANIFPQFTQPGAELAEIPKEVQDIRLKAAQAERERAKAKLPFGGEIPPGPAGQVVGLEMVKQLYGENSPQYQQAKSAYDLSQKGTQSRIRYQNILADTADKRFSTPLAKTVQEFEDVKNGYLPGTKTPMSEEQRIAYQGMYGLDLIKKTTDTDTRKKNLYSTNMDITMGLINPYDLTQYSGVAGGMQLLADKRDSLMGKSVPRYEAYERSMTAAKMLAKQVRQFYGDSITPAVQEGLKELTNPTSWLKSPNVALQKFNQFTQLLTAESKTYKTATGTPAIYSGEQGLGQNAPAAAPGQQGSMPQNPNSPYSPQTLQNQPAAQNEGMANVPAPAMGGNPPPPGKIAIIDSNGEEHIIDADKFEQAKLVDPGVRKKEGANAAP